MDASLAETRTDLRELVSFRAGKLDFCVDIALVREIRAWTPATVLPHAPDYVMGVINLRGAVVPIVDLAARLGMGKLEPHGRHVIIITVIEDQTIGLLVDSVSDILGVARSAVQSTPDVTAEVTRKFVEGVIAFDDKMLRLLHLRALLAAPGQEAA